MLNLCSQKTSTYSDCKSLFQPIEGHGLLETTSSFNYFTRGLHPLTVGDYETARIDILQCWCPLPHYTRPLNSA